MGDSKHINKIVETIDMLIFSAIEQLKKVRNGINQPRKRYKPTNITKYDFPY